jgi:hypothetical protein
MASTKTAFVLSTLLAAALTGCTMHSTGEAVTSSVAACPGCPAVPPGTVQYVWEEPMVDVIDVPPGLDPDGIYYRPSHQEVVEIRQGRWKYYNKNR